MIGYSAGDLAVIVSMVAVAAVIVACVASGRPQ